MTRKSDMQKFLENKRGNVNTEAPKGPGRYDEAMMKEKHKYDKAPGMHYRDEPAESGLRDQFGKPVKIDKIA